MRIGHGFDVHAFGVGDALILGGVSIPFEHAFIAHSDGDVLTHAFMDSILGALSLGDIGRHFPDTDMMVARGYRIGNADLTIVAQNPKMAPHITPMIKKLAAVLACDYERINIKATTSESLGFTGRGEGIACHASVLLESTSD